MGDRRAGPVPPSAGTGLRTSRATGSGGVDADGQDEERRKAADAERNGRADHNSKNAEADDRGERNKDRQCKDRK
jgi:hypothetical protein